MSTQTFRDHFSDFNDTARRDAFLDLGDHLLQDVWRFGADGSLDVRMVGRDYYVRVQKQFPECRLATRHVERLVAEAERKMQQKGVDASWDEEYVSANKCKINKHVAA